MSARVSSATSAGAEAGQGGRSWRIALALALVALLSGIALAGTSAWFLGAVALAGAGPAAFAFNFHIPAALVRLFALSRTAARYGERVAGHKAALHDQVQRRTRLFVAMATSRAALGAGWQLARQDRLADYLDDVDDKDFARLRFGLPGFALCIGLALLTGLTAVVAPLAALLPVAVVAAGGAALTAALLPRLRRRRRAARAMRASAAGRLGGVFAARVPLRAEGRWANGLRAGFARLRQAARREEGFERDLALLGAAAGMAGPVAALGVLLACWHQGLRGHALLPAAFVAFGWLALGESAAGLARMIAGRVREKDAEIRLATWGAESRPPQAETREEGRAECVSLIAFERTSPDGRPLAGPVDLTCRRGETVVLSGPSGCGKTTLLKQIAGWIPVARRESLLVDGRPGDVSGQAFLGLHDAAVLADTVRENLFAPSASEAACWGALEAVELAPRIRQAGGLDAWIAQDRLSLGEAQRLNLARAWLSTAPVVLLDEPAEHVGDAQARRILKRLQDRLSDRILIVAAHKADAWSGTARHVRLDARVAVRRTHPMSGG